MYVHMLGFFGGFCLPYVQMFASEQEKCAEDAANEQQKGRQKLKQRETSAPLENLGV